MHLGFTSGRKSVTQRCGLGTTEFGESSASLGSADDSLGHGDGFAVSDDQQPREHLLLSHIACR